MAEASLHPVGADQVKHSTMDLGALLQDSDQNLGVSRAAYIKGLQQHVNAASMLMKGVSSSWKVDPSEVSSQQKTLLQAELTRTSSKLTALEEMAPILEGSPKGAQEYFGTMESSRWSTRADHFLLPIVSGTYKHN